MKTFLALDSSPWCQFWITFPVGVVLGLSSCAPSSPRGVEVGKTTAAQLQTQLGPPVKTLTSAVRPQATVLYYGDGSRFQLEGGVVRVKSWAPEPQERALQVWRQRWRVEAVTDEAVHGTRGPHGITERELRAPRLGLSVIYAASTGQVLEVVQYGAVSMAGGISR